MEQWTPVQQQRSSSSRCEGCYKGRLQGRASSTPSHYQQQQQQQVKGRGAKSQDRWLQGTSMQMPRLCRRAFLVLLLSLSVSQSIAAEVSESALQRSAHTASSGDRAQQLTGNHKKRKEGAKQEREQKREEAKQQREQKKKENSPEYQCKQKVSQSRGNATHKARLLAQVKSTLDEGTSASAESECEMHESLSRSFDWVKPYQKLVLDPEYAGCNLASCNNSAKCNIPPCMALEDEDGDIDRDCPRDDGEKCGMPQLRNKPSVGQRRKAGTCSPFTQAVTHCDLLCELYPKNSLKHGNTDCCCDGRGCGLESKMKEVKSIFPTEENRFLSFWMTAPGGQSARIGLLARPDKSLGQVFCSPVPYGPSFFQQAANKSATREIMKMTSTGAWIRPDARYCNDKLQWYSCTKGSISPLSLPWMPPFPQKSKEMATNSALFMVKSTVCLRSLCGQSVCPLVCHTYKTGQCLTFSVDDVRWAKKHFLTDVKWAVKQQTELNGPRSGQLFPGLSLRAGTDVSLGRALAYSLFKANKGKRCSAEAARSAELLVAAN